MIKKIEHVVITNNNIENYINFYKKFGFSSKEMSKKYKLNARNVKINLNIKGYKFLPYVKNLQASRDNLCFKINTNIDEPKKYLEQNEIQIERGIVECTGVFGNMKSIYLKKTNGNLIELSNHRITESKPWKI
ncbi:TPA: VOC family protein [Clostridioides difficile]|uniref:VOC domain-containing protein n=4 Tax=Clostridioides difficile TaxID=1496 RepID=A0A069AIT0_CLODI|nr:VOC family protein [Clostridioides difficile]AXU73255.1 putative glyoxalase [Clostridioides difficile]AXU80711.1 putative glyoxalase [Clostridioides difficile]EGT3767326.1 VOC family protein [Clostridioides difficile]EGT4113239.1 VOC family protein [Clostridioides difficile]EGT4515021.1 VOC family protein [Clostridioides difficile]